MASQPVKYILLGNINTGQIIYEDTIVKDNKSHLEAKQIFDKLSKLEDKKYDQQTKISSSKGNYYFTTTNPDLFFLTLSDDEYAQRHVFELLDHIKRENIHLMVNEKGEIN